MGWASGSELFDSIIKSAKKHIKNSNSRREFYKEVIAAFEDHDWDTQNECEGKDKAYDTALKELHPGWFEE